MKNVKGAMDHLKNHQSYPTTREELVKECNNLADYSAEDKKWFMNHLPKGTYNSADEVIKATGMAQAM